MGLTGWKRLLADADWCRGKGRFPIPAYSEFMPPPWVGLKPYGGVAQAPLADARGSWADARGSWADAHGSWVDDNWGWNVTEYEQAHELRPGMRVIAREVLKEVVKLGRGLPTPQISRRKLQDNPYWPPELAAHAGRLHHERYVVIVPLALSRTQDDKGRVRWTLFGSSEQGPARPFWKGFFTGPRRAVPAAFAFDFFRRLLSGAFGVPDEQARDPTRAGLRILLVGEDDRFPFWTEGALPDWAEELVWKETRSLKGVRFLLTFRPFARLPAAVQNAYLAGDLHLLPFPGSLVFWGAPRYRELQRELPFAVQIPLLHLFPRYNNPYGIRIPQAGWLHERLPRTALLHTPHRPHVQRSHRWQPVSRDQDETAVLPAADRVTRVLFSTDPKDLGLYDKPMARNAELWTTHYHLLLDGPWQGRDAIAEARRVLNEGGEFGYRFVFPAMRVGPWSVYWQRPLVAFPGSRLDQPVVVEGGPEGYLTAYEADEPDLQDPVELWPRLLQRPPHVAAVALFAQERQPRRFTTTLNVRSILDHHELLGGPLPRSFARALLAAPKEDSLEQWLASLPGRASDPDRARPLVRELEARLEKAGAQPQPGESLTFAHTARRPFEVAYWKTIAALAHGKFRNKDNADCILDEATRAALRHHHRDLEALGDYLMRHYARAIRRAGLAGKAWVGEHAFLWQTDFDFSWSDGWSRNQDGRGYERNIVARIPGRDHRQAVIMADHYDTAYMADRFDPRYGGTGARVAAAGADDNHSATAALMLAAPIFLELSRAGRLGCDVWLVHLTGEEFPADCLGARHLCQALVENSLSVREPDGTVHDLSGVRIRGVYVSDMIAHNNDRDRYVFQISPGEGPASAWLALQAHQATEAWNARAREENQKPPRKGRGPGQRVAQGRAVPPLARFAELRGEVRPEWDPRSTLYNTDGQIFSDAGIPVVLFMEDYDINRTGYHDSHDTLANIDLDYGAALAAIVIESVARAAAAEPPASALRS